MEKKVVVIIVTYNGERWIKRNLTSLIESTYPLSIIVVDNNSIDNTISIVEQFTSVHLIKLKENIGFGKANNIAIKEAELNGFDFIFLLNQDTWIYPNTIIDLVKTTVRHKEAGIISPMHLSGDGKTLDSNFEVYFNRKKSIISKNLIELPFVNAAAWLIPKDVQKKIGFFETLFSHYGEDRNYTDRLLFHGYKVIVNKKAIICHDRLILRNINKDIKQGKFNMLASVLNINLSIFKGYFNALKSVFGLPKFFFKSYGKYRIVKMFFNLLFYFFYLIFRIKLINYKRKSYY